MLPSPAPSLAWQADPSLLAMSLLIVDDEKTNIALLQYMLGAAGFRRVQSTTDPRLVLKLCAECQPDLILLDLMMPHRSGFEVAEDLRREIPEANRPPILVLTADATAESRYRALAAGAADFLLKPFDELEVLLRIKHLLKIQSQHRQLATHNDLLEETVRERTSELRQTLGQLQTTVEQLQVTQRQVIRHERLSALGSMAAGLAHDFNNSLSLILGYGELLLEDLVADKPRPATLEFLRTIIAAAQDAAGMFGRLRVFHRPLDGARPGREVDINQLVEQAIGLTRPRWHGQALGEAVTISMEADLCPGLPSLLADGPELCEMFTNLIFNAVDAMPGGGCIGVRTRFAAAGGADGSIPAGEPDEIVIEVTDTGLGMSEEVRSRCLEPFFTTKGQQGNGLGLAMVYGTMQRHGGRIEVQSALGVGTCFILRLPVRPQCATNLPETPPVAQEGSLRILVVDDQPAFVSLIERHLLVDGHQVDTAGNGDEALAKCRALAYDLVITDRAMPGMSGDSLALQIKNLAPATLVILLTGFHKLEGNAEAAGAVDLVLSKPVTQAMLRAAVSRVRARQTAG